MTRRCPIWFWPVLLVALVGARQAGAQAGHRARYRVVEEPRWLRLQITEATAGVYVEGAFEETTYRSSATTVRYERFFAAPSLSLGMAGSLYHSNLARFRFTSEGAYGWAESRTESLTATTRREEWQYYGRFRGAMDLLANKPLRGNLFAGYGRSYRDYDFFSRATVDRLNYGSRLLYSRPRLALTAQYEHIDEDVLDTSEPATTEQDLASFDVRADRARGSSGLNYTFNQFTTSDADSAGTTVDHTVTLADAQRFGRGDQLQLNSSASYTRRDSDLEESNQLTATAAARASHRPDLSSAYDVSYDRFETPDLTADSVAGSVGVSHRLYQSLDSGLTVSAANYESSSDAGDGYSRRYGAAWSEVYSKRLGPDHRLRLDNTLAVDHVAEKTTGRVVNERHVFPAPPATESFLLNLANVDEASVVVTDASGLTVFVRGLDYALVPSGARTEVQRIPGGTIPEGATVLVDYDAEPTPAGGYETFTDAAGLRLDFWRGLWGVYGRVRLSRDNADDDLRVREVTSYIAGTDVTWKWFAAGAEYVQYESADTDYWSVRLFQSANFRPDEVSSVGLNLAESYTEYQDADRDEQNYRATVRYRRSVSRRLLFHLDAGLNYRHGATVDQTRAVARPELKYWVGRTSVQLAYDYEYNLYLDNEERNKHRFTLTVRREF